MALYKGSTKICPIITKGITPTGTINITENGTVDVTNYASANVSVSGGGGGSSNFDLPSNMKIIKATSMDILINDTDIDIENLLSDGDEVLPFLIFCCPEEEVEVATDDFYDLTGGFFLSFCFRSYALANEYSIGMNESYQKGSWNGKVFAVSNPAYYSLSDGEGTIEYMESGTIIIRLSVTWDVPA